MFEILQMAGFLVAAFGIAYVIGALLGRSRKRKVVLVPLSPGSRVRMVGPGGTYRCFYLGRKREELMFSAPIQGDRYVPVRIGQGVMVQSPVADSILTFRSSVTHWNPETHQFSLAVPTTLRQLDRRTEPRNSILDGTIVRLNGEPASVCNLSAGGARITTTTAIRSGDMLRLEVAEQPEICGWALESTPTDAGTYHVRVCFAEPLAGISGLQRRKLYLGR